MNTVLLFDGNPMMWRAVYAQNESYVAQGIIRYFFEVVEKFDCSNTLLFWDSGKSRWRSKFFPDYKIHRQEKKSEFDLVEMGEQKKIAQKYLEYLGVRNITVHGVEADDLLSVFAQYLSNIFDRVIVVSRDRDLWQLITDKVLIYDPFSDQVIDRETCEESLGVLPEQIVDYKSVVGDTSDGLKGVRGIGEKTTKKLIDQFGGVEGFLSLENIEELSKKKTTEKVLKSSEELELTYQLVKLPSLGEIWAYLSKDELEVMKSEITKPVKTDSMSAQIEAEIIGCSQIAKRAVSSLSNEVLGILPYLEHKTPQNPFSLRSVDIEISGCNNCSLYNSDKIYSEGYEDSQIMLIGRDFRSEECRAVLGQFLTDIGLGFRQVWLSSVCKCFVKDRPLSYGEVRACSSYIRSEIDLIKPKFIITFGSEAMSLVTPYSSLSSKHAGEILEKPSGSLGYIDSWVAIMVDINSSLRSNYGKANFEYGVEKIKEFLDERRN